MTYEAGGIRSGEIRRSFERLSPGKWQTPVFSSPWANTTGRTTRFRLDNADTVRVEGRFGGGVDGTVAWVMPADMRPQQEIDIPIRTDPATAAGEFARLETSGNVRIYGVVDFTTTITQASASFTYTTS